MSDLAFRAWLAFAAAVLSTVLVFLVREKVLEYRRVVELTSRCDTIAMGYEQIHCGELPRDAGAYVVVRRPDGKLVVQENVEVQHPGGRDE